MADFAAQTVVELKEECRSRGLTLGGVKKELIKRLKAFEAKAARAKAKEQDKAAATVAPKAAQADPVATSMTNVTAAQIPAEVETVTKSAETPLVSESLLQPVAEQQLLEPADETQPAPCSPSQHEAAPVATEAIAPEAVAPEAVAPEAVAPEAVAPETVATETTSSEAPATAPLAPEAAPAAVAPEAVVSPCGQKSPVPESSPDSPVAPARLGYGSSRSPLAQGSPDSQVESERSRSRSPLLRKQVASKTKFVLTKRRSVLERAERASQSTDESESEASSQDSSSSRSSMRSCSPSQSVCSPASKSRRLRSPSPAPKEEKQEGPRNCLFNAAIAAITPSKNGPASATPRKQKTPSADPMSIERARQRADELRQRLMMSLSPAPKLNKVWTPATGDLNTRYHDFLTSPASGLTQQQDNLLHSFMNTSSTPKLVAAAPADIPQSPAVVSARPSPAAEAVVPQSPGGAVAPRNLTWALQDALVDETTHSKREQVNDGKAKMLDQLTKQLQVCLARLQDQRLDDASREKYQTLAASVKAQMDKVTDLKRPTKGMRMHSMTSPAATRGGC